MVRAIKSENGLIYFCGECGQKLEKLEVPFVFLDGVKHVVLRCPVCFTLSSVREIDCGNKEEKS